MKVAVDFIEQDFSGKQIILKESNTAFAKAVAAKIFKDIGCEVHIVKDFDSLKKAIATNGGDFFVGVFDYSSDKPADMDAIEFALGVKLPVIALAKNSTTTREINCCLKIS